MSSWLERYQPDLPITVFFIDADGEGQDFFQIGAADGPLFVTKARLPLEKEAEEGGMVVHVSALKRSGFLDEYNELLVHFQHARIVLNDKRNFVAPNNTVH